ncbi:cupin domain-containing protein [Lysinibacillus sp. NPDC094403]|uniref:cupin domain-containing protein n=1 Tax=Lysinibacillus sp. NPDC094403 TaxID=3390581 RepID=UPI003D07633C
MDSVEGGFVKYSLSTNLENKQLVPRLIEILPQKKDEEIFSYKHEEEEFIYVLEGILTVYINGKSHEVYPDDSVHMGSNIAYNWANYTNKKIKIMAVNTAYFSIIVGLILYRNDRRRIGPHVVAVATLSHRQEHVVAVAHCAFAQKICRTKHNLKSGRNYAKA